MLRGNGEMTRGTNDVSDNERALMWVAANMAVLKTADSKCCLIVEWSFLSNWLVWYFRSHWLKYAAYSQNMFSNMYFIRTWLFPIGWRALLYCNCFYLQKMA